MKTTTTRQALKVPVTLPGSSMSAVHRDSGPVGAALADLPQWRDLMEQIIHVNATRPQRANYAGLDEEMELVVRECASQRAALDLDTALDHARKVTDRLTSHEALNRAFTRVSESLVQQLDTVARGQAPALYGALSQELVTLVSEARKIADVLTMDAETAVRRDKTEQWQRAQELFADARRLRASRLQLERLGGSDDPTAPTYLELRWLRNPTEVWGHWRAWRVDGALVNLSDVGDRKPLTAPWPDYRYGKPTVDEAERWLAYFAQTPEAVPWVPSPAQLAEAARHLSDLAAGLRPTNGRSYEENLPGGPVAYVEHSHANVRSTR